MSPYLASSMSTLSNDQEALSFYPLRILVFHIFEPMKAYVRSLIKSFQLKKIRLQAKALRSSKTVLIVCAFNEEPRLRFFFDYYLSIGIDHFILIDNRSTDRSIEIAESYDCVSIYSARGSYKASRFGVDWINFILSRYCSGKWIVFADVDEFLTFSYAGGQLLPLVSKLEAAGRNSLQSVMLDMYSNAPGGAPLYLDDGQDPLETSPYYDSAGYFIGRELVSNTTWIKGGVRNRLFFDRVGSGPALNKTPLVKWRRYFAFLKSAHQVWPASINGVGGVPESALLHFKFVSSSSLYNAAIAAQHTSEYKAYSHVQEMGTFRGSVTRTYSGPEGLISDGIIADLL